MFDCSQKIDVFWAKKIGFWINKFWKGATSFCMAINTSFSMPCRVFLCILQSLVLPSICRKGAFTKTRWNRRSFWWTILLAEFLKLVHQKDRLFHRVFWSWSHLLDHPSFWNWYHLAVLLKLVAVSCSASFGFFQNKDKNFPQESVTNSKDFRIENQTIT